MKTLITILLTLGLSFTGFAGNNKINKEKSTIRKEVFIKKVKRNKIIATEITIKNNRTIKGEKKVYNKNGKLLRSKLLKQDKINTLRLSRQNIALRLPFSDRLNTNPKYRA
ncbi:MAG TPA: hypothetical protein DIU39_05350 [Flavobacteriales bacterium]|nr:hypothetical protein [Flavobacteriales bacterium]|tara:strand:+ start:5427 stop:5759 length:333 start_codon:yes stop_codon:yes gene_type:complete